MSEMNSEQLILYRLDQQDKASSDFRAEARVTSDKLLDVCNKTNGRVSSLERWRYLISGGLAVVIVIMGWLVALKAK
jgi:hypothetical protein